jgi:hypothetical protein
MRRLRVSELLIGFLLGFAVLLLIFVLSSDIAAHYEICEATKEGAKECAGYGVIGFTFRKVGGSLNDYNGLITATATIFIAWFTLSLRQATDRLWFAGERSAIIQRRIGEAQVRAYVSIKSVQIYFGGDDGMPFIEVVAANSGQSPAINFVWAPEIYYLSETVEEVVKEVSEEWADQPGLDIHSASQNSAIYVVDDFVLAEKIAVDGVVPDRIAVSITVHYTWTDVFGESFMDYASFAGMAEIGDAKANRKRHPLNTSPWHCRLNPIAKGEPWSGIAVRAPADDDHDE